VLVVGRLRHVEAYAMAWDDWLWYGVCPLVAYAALVVAAVLLPGDPTLALVGVGAVLLVLLVLGIRNAWDVVTYLAIEVLPAQDAGKGEGKDEGERTG
jgi:hypothetical protein